MNAAQRWAYIADVLSRALDLPEAERTGFLHEVSREQPELRTEILALYGELPGAEDFLETPASAALAAPAAEVPASFGAYRVVGELGEGGMGVVYLAERNDGQFTRRVAVKRVGRAAPDGEALRRFRDERQILARLDHPHIARLLDAGLDAGGVPYLLMEHVEGRPLTTYCRERGLGVPERLTLFLQVCAAAQAAHQSLVIHRDLKPGNILVTEDGQAKLLDFGIAKVVSDNLGGDATQTVNRALTLDYASPEQVRGDPVTTASDVYSLGVVLYELLAGRKPYEASTQSLTEALRIVCEQTPPPPSRVAPAERRSEVEGDLDSIVGKAMEKAPAERYASVSELAADISAHLAHLPVQARGPSFGYVARKFLRRHRTGTAVTAALLALAAAGVAAVLWQARVAERERARAVKRFGEVRQLANYVIFDLQDGVARLTGSTELRRKMVERSLAYLDSLAADAAGDAALQRELAGAYLRLGEVLGQQDYANVGDRQGALASYGKAQELLRQVISRDPHDADARRQLGRLLVTLPWVDTALKPDERERAVKRLQESLALWQELVREAPGDEVNQRGMASAHYSLYLARRKTDPAASLDHLERARRTFQAELDARPEDPDLKRSVAQCHKSLSAALLARDPAQAHQHALDAARLDSERVAAEPNNARAKLDYTQDLGSLGDYHLARHEPAEALRFFQQALGIRRELYEADRADTLAWNRLAYMLMKVGETHLVAGQPEQAAPFLKEAVELARALPDQHQHWVVMTLSRSYLGLGEVERKAKRSPCAWYGRMEESLREVPDPQPYFQGESAALLKQARERLKACPKSS